MKFPSVHFISKINLRIHYSALITQKKYSFLYNTHVILLYAQVCATLGTTGACSFDNIKEIGPICEYRVYFRFTLNY